MKYKVGDEVLVKVQIVEDGIYGYGLKTTDGILFTAKRDSVFPIPTMTAEEAWELARRIEGMRSDDLLEIFDMDSTYCILQDFSPQEAKAKIEAWEAAKEIKVGDFVEIEDKIFCVTSLAGEYCCGIDENGSVYSASKKGTKKTGRHIDIDGILKQIGGNK